MLKNFRDKIAFSGISVLIIGLVLLIFTFISAYGFLTAGLSIVSSQDLVQPFGETLAPLIATCIPTIYLGVMVWVGSIITVRGVTIITHAAQPVAETPHKPVAVEPKLQSQSKHQAQPQSQQQTQKPKAEKRKEERTKEKTPKEIDKSPEPEIVVMPSEEVAETPQDPPQQSSS